MRNRGNISTEKDMKDEREYLQGDRDNNVEHNYVGTGEMGNILLLLLRSNHNKQHLQVLYLWGIRRRKTGKHIKLGEKRKWLVLAQPPYSPKGNGRQTSRWNQGHKPPYVEENPGCQYHQNLGGQAGL